MSSFVVEIEVGGLELEVHGDLTLAVPGRISGPPENCFPDEPEEFDINSAFLLVHVADDLSPDAKAMRTIRVDILDLINELDFCDTITRLAYEELERKREEYEP